MHVYLIYMNRGAQVEMVSVATRLARVLRDSEEPLKSAMRSALGVRMLVAFRCFHVG